MPSSLSAETILSSYELSHDATKDDRRYDVLWAEARANATETKRLAREAKKKGKDKGRTTTTTATVETTAATTKTASPAPPTLAYITPWNRRGFDSALRHKGKLTHVSPVWYQIVPASKVKNDDNRSGGGSVGPVLQGGEGVDETWLAEMKKPLKQKQKKSGGTTVSGTKILPRVSLELDRFSLALLLGGAASHARAVGRQLDREATVRGYDGWVLEAWPAWSALAAPPPPPTDGEREAHKKQLEQAAIGAAAFFREVASALHGHERDHPLKDSHAEHFGGVREDDERRRKEHEALLSSSSKTKKRAPGPRTHDDPPHLLALAVPPPPDRRKHREAHEAYLSAVARLRRHVDLWSLMTYDYFDDDGDDDDDEVEENVKNDVEGDDGGDDGDASSSFSPSSSPPSSRRAAVYSSTEGPPPNAPLPWVRSSALALARAVGDRKKVLTGLAFYAVSWDVFTSSSSSNGGKKKKNKKALAVEARNALTCHDALGKLREAAASNATTTESGGGASGERRRRSLDGRWDELGAEASFDLPRSDSDKFSRMWMPTLPSVEARLKIAAEVGTGVSIWEIGQGAEAFFDLL